MHQSTLFDLTGRTALVTGSTRGIGAELARGLAEAGAHVIVHGRHEPAIDDAVRTLCEDGLAASGAAFDVTDETAVNDGVADIERRHGALDILVNNAGIQRRAPFTTFATADWEALVATNLTSAFLVSRAVATGMTARGRGKIICIGSVQSRLGRPGIAPYAATKGGIAMLTRGLCADLGPAGIQVNALAPGYIATELTRPLVDDPEFSAWVGRRTPAARWGTPSDLVGTMVFLASSASDFVNGQIIYVDGGMTAVV